MSVTQRASVVPAPGAFSAPSAGSARARRCRSAMAFARSVTFGRRLYRWTATFLTQRARRFPTACSLRVLVSPRLNRAAIRDSMLMLFAEPVAPPDAQRPGCGCVGSFGRQIRCRGLSPAAVGELWRSPEPAAAPPVSRASSDPTAGQTTTSSWQFSPYPCDPCDPWFISGSFLDHGLHGFHGWARHRGCGSGRANQTVEATATRPLALMAGPGDFRGVCGRCASPHRYPATPGNGDRLFRPWRRPIPQQSAPASRRSPPTPCTSAGLSAAAYDSLQREAFLAGRGAEHIVVVGA